MDYYSILGLDKSASQDDIKKAYRRLASKHHPDRGGDEAQFKKIQQAYDVLSNKQSKSEYDNPVPEMDMENFWKNFDSHFGHRTHAKNANIDLSVTVLASEIFEPLEKVVVARIEGINVTRTIQIPAGINNGSVIRFKGLGDNRWQDLPPGDLRVTVFVSCPNQWYKSELDLHTTIDIDVFDAILGCSQTITNLNQKKLNVKIPAGCSHDKVLKLKGQGYTARGKTGDLFVHVNTTIPAAKTAEQISAINTAKQLFNK